MKALLIFTTLLGLSSAYALPGAYERMWFYYAYLADISLGSTQYSSKIAKKLL
jgi:hypothetical protein